MTETARWWIKVLLERLFAAEDRRLTKAIDSLIERNNVLVHRPYATAFTYLGERYGWNGPQKNVPSLALELRGEMEFQLKLQKGIDLDRALIRQSLSLLLDPCEGTQNYRDALPECLVDLDPVLSSHPRLMPPAYTLSDERHRRQYEKILPKIEMYCATRLLY